MGKRTPSIYSTILGLISYTPPSFTPPFELLECWSQGPKDGSSARACCARPSGRPALAVHISLNSLNGAIQEVIYGTSIGVLKGDARSLEYSSCELYSLNS